MKTLEERVRKGHECIAKAKAQGKETKKWEEHLANLDRQLAEQQEGKPSGQRVIKGNPIDDPKVINDPNLRVRVKMGAFGFCTCLVIRGLCAGCWKVKEACACRELEVNPEQEITRQYALFLKKINTPLRIAKH